MSSYRRDFLTKLFSCGAMGGLLAPALLEAELKAAELPLEPQDEAPHDSLAFWSGFFDSVNPNVPNSQKRGDDTSNMPDQGRIVQYLHYNDEKGLRFVEYIDKQELLDYDGDILVSASLGQYRPAAGDTTPSQFRLDCVQTKPIMEVLSPLAWSAMVALMPDKAGSIPSLDQLGFKSGSSTTGTDQIVLPKGIGKISVNVTRSNTKMQAFFGTVLKYAKMAAPVLSLPAISVPAIQTFSEVYSYWEERTRFVLNSPLQLSIASQAAAADPESQSARIKLLSGYYVMLPQQSASQVASYADKLTVQSGYLVEKSASQNVAPKDLYQKSLPGITYATMRVNVSQLDASKLSASSSSAAGEAGGGGGGKSGGSKSGSAAKGKSTAAAKESEKPCVVTTEKPAAKTTSH